MNQVELKAFAKINLTLDVQGLLENGYHKVEMILQQILLHDDVTIKWQEGTPADSLCIDLSSNRHFLPTNERNLAYKAALLMAGALARRPCGTLEIHIKKRIPVAAGLAGGSSNGAAVIHGLNLLWNCGFSLKELCGLGAGLGSDVPFCIMGQAATNDCLRDRFPEDPLAAHCALASGTGTDLLPIKGLRSHLALSKPAVAVSTAEVYRGIDGVPIPRRPDNRQMIIALEKNNPDLIKKNMINVLENFTLTRYPIVVYTKNKIQNLCNSGCVLMSGSGPTVFCLCGSREEAQQICQKMLEDNRESFWTRTTW